MKRLLLVVLTSIGFLSVAFSQATLEGVVKDEETGELIILGSVALYKNDVLITGTETDFDGYYSIANIDPGTYDVVFSYTGYTSKKIEGVVLAKGKALKLDGSISSGITIELGVEVVGYKAPLIEQDNTSQGYTVTSEEIKALPTRSINSIAATTAGVASSDDGSGLNFRGSRQDATNYYVDGIRVRSSMIPNSEIDQLQMITAGIEAQYGDVTGGIVSITTKGPSNQFSGGLEVETSKFLDAFGYSFATANVSGPIWQKKYEDGTKRSILGFRLSGAYTRREEDSPPATPLFFLKDEVRQSLEQNPVMTVPGTNTRIVGLENVTYDDVDALDASPYELSENINLNAKIDARLSDAIDISLTGAFTTSDNMFTPGGWRMANSVRNPTQEVTRYRGNVRLRHRLGGGNNIAIAEEGTEPKNSLIRNAAYTLQAGYEKDFSDVSDPIHKDNFFNYGYIGQFDYSFDPFIGRPGNLDPDTTFGWAHIDYSNNFVGYTPNMDINPILARYNNLSDFDDEFDFLALNGGVSSNYTSAWGLNTNVGTVYNRANKTDNDLFTFGANATFDFYPGGSDKGRHNVQFGILYEQRTNRGWSIAPVGLWDLARQSANRHLTGVDTSVILYYDTMFYIPPGFPIAIPIHPALADADIDDDLLFYKSVRELLNVDVNTHVNIDAIHPDDLSLDMFSAVELTDLGLVSYSGFDYLGNKLEGTSSFNDFYNVDPATGRRTYQVAPYQPNYAAAYVQDKFTFKDIIFRLGLRVDRFDANTKVLKDPYSFYEVYGAGDFHNQFGGSKPGTIGDEFKVYVSDQGSANVTAYRDGDQWYFPNGTSANDGREIFGGEIVTPKLINPDINVRSDEFDPNSTFKDYEPDIIWMPRLAFSFPISDIANFFAHYDVLVQRPTNNFVSALRYYYFNEPGRISAGNPINNPDLKPQRTIDYAVGFQQKLSNTSALKLNAYYREMRDMIQAKTYLYIPAPLNQYETYGNEDFGTVKGFTLQYDLRRTNNIRMRVDYTLQFADGTGSGVNSQRGSANRGNLRVLFPLSYDERHRINLNLDYRYGSGKRYNGPVWFGQDVFANAGVNLQAVTFSGRPYTKAQRPERFGGSGIVGSLNGARRPWTFRLDLRVDKSFTIAKPEARYPLAVNVFLRVNNLLDSRNIISVYRATGSPNDDGYLASSAGQAIIKDLDDSGRISQPYLDQYDMALNNPYNYSLPRRIVLGATFDF